MRWRRGRQAGRTNHTARAVHGRCSLRFQPADCGGPPEEDVALFLLTTEFATGAERRGVAFRPDIVSADPHAVVQRERTLCLLLLWVWT